MKLGLKYSRPPAPVSTSWKYSLALAAAAAALGVAALANRRLAKKAERDNPPAGKFINVGNVRLHYVDQGAGEPIILLHGNGSMIQDFASSGLIEMAVAKASRHCFRPAWVWPQRAPTRNRLDARGASRPYPPRDEADRHYPCQGSRSFLGSVGRSCSSVEASRDCRPA